MSVLIDVTENDNTVSLELTENDNTVSLTIAESRDAYQIAVANGFVGSVTEWLASIGSPGIIGGSTLTSLTGILKGNGTDIDVAVAGTDYLTPTGDGSGLSGVTANITTSTPTNLTGLLKGNGTDVDVAVEGTDYLSPTGDGSNLTGIETTPADGSITNAKLANMSTATIKGQIVGGSGAPIDLTPTEARLILNVEDGATAFNQASPGAIGGTTPSSGAFTTLSATGQFTVSTNGAVSTPAGKFTGTWFTGGTTTTTKPQFLIEPTGTTSTGWSTSGTGFGLNAASGFTGNLFDFRVAGVSKLKYSAAGLMTAPSAFGVLADTLRLDFNNPTTGDLLMSVGSNYTILLSSGTGRGLFLASSYRLGWSSSDTNVTGSFDVVLNKEAVAHLGLRNSTTAQTFSIANTWTSTTNYERLELGWAANVCTIDTTKGSGGGTLRGLKIGGATTSLLGFYGATPVVQQVLATGGGATVDNVITLLQTLGLCKQS